MLPLFLNLLLSDEEREICEEDSLERPGLRMDLEEIFMDDEEERREVKQMKSSLVLLPLVLLLLMLVLRWGLSGSIITFLLDLQIPFLVCVCVDGQ